MPNIKPTRSNLYQGVYYFKTKNPYWQAVIKLPDSMWYGNHTTERNAAIEYDKQRIKLGRKPINVLKQII